MNNFREGLNALREISDPEKAKLILEKITGKKLADYEGIDALIGALMGYYNEENKKKLDKGTVPPDWDTAEKIKGKVEEKQNKQDDTLETTAKEIVPAINEINELAKKDKGERLPIGTIVPFVTDTIPLGYLLCDGREITQQDYPELYKILPFGGYIAEKVFRSLAKNEVPIMRSNTQDGFTITTSSEYSTSYQGWEAFDNSMGDNDGWITQNGEKNGVLTIEFPFERALSSFELTSINNSQKCHIKIIKVYGVYGNSEDEIFNETLTSVFTIKETRKFDIALKTKKYNKFKIEIINEESDVGTGLVELKLYTVDMSQFPNANQSTSKKYLPDLRDMFLRGNKQGRQLLSWQNDDNKKHNHRYPLYNIVDATVQRFYKELKLDNNPITYYYDGGTLSDNGYGTPISQETFTGTESRPQNISVNYIIKAKNVSSEDTISPVIDEVNTKIETNRKGLVDLKAEYEGYISKDNETKLLYSSKNFVGNTTITLNENITNFKKLEIEVMGNGEAYKSIHYINTDRITYDNATVGLNSPNVYFLDSHYQAYSAIIFRTNEINAYVIEGTAYISKITGVGRTGGN